MKNIYAVIIALTGLHFQCSAAFSDEIQEIKCHAVRMSMEMDHDESSRVTVAGSDIERLYAESKLPKECQTVIYTYGNGFIDMEDVPPQCWEAAAPDASPGVEDFVKKLYPLEYKVSENKLKFEKRISAKFPEVGKVKLSISGYYDLLKMTFHSNVEMETRNPIHVLSADGVSQCQ